MGRVRTSRGVRNNNPGNIKDFGTSWEGMLPHAERNDAQRAEHVFVVFRHPWWGIRAMAMILRNYSRKHGLNSVEQLMTRWAPQSDSNPTYKYVEFVAAHLGVSSGDTLDLNDFHTMRRLVQAVVQFENGFDPYTWEYDTGLILLGIEPPVAG